MNLDVNITPLSRQVAWVVSLCVAVAAGCASAGQTGFDGADAGGGGSGGSGSGSGNGSGSGAGSGDGGSGSSGGNGSSGGSEGSEGSSSGTGDDAGLLGDDGGDLLGDSGTVNTGTGACTQAGSDRTTTGCDYFVVQPDVIFEGVGACFAAFLANTSMVPVHIGVSYGTQSLDVTKFAYIPVGTGTSLKYSPLANGVLGPGQVTILFLSKYAKGFPSLPPLNYNCPAGVTPAITTLDPAPHGTSLGTAFHITTDGPVVAYDEYPYGGGQSAMTSATLLLPVSSWDTNYVAVDGFAASQLSGGLSFIDVVGEQDGTTVTISPSAAITAGKGVAGAAQGTPTTYTVDRGQILQFTQSAELGGSILQSSQPVGVWGGHTGLNIGTNDCCADGAHQQIPPVRALGSEYVGVRYRDRYTGTDESPPWRLVGAANGTTLTYDPAPPSGAPTTLSLGQVAEFDAGDPFVITSQDAQHPFYMSGHMTGAGPYDPKPDRWARGSRVRQRDPAGRVSVIVRVLHRPDVPRDEPRLDAGAGLERFRGRVARLRRHADGMDAGGQRRQVRVHAHRPVHRQLPGPERVQQRQARDHERGAFRPDGLGVGIGRHGQRADRLLHAVRELRVPRRPEHRALKRRRHPAYVAVGSAPIPSAAASGRARRPPGGV